MDLCSVPLIPRLTTSPDFGLFPKKQGVILSCLVGDFAVSRKIRAAALFDYFSDLRLRSELSNDDSNSRERQKKGRERKDKYGAE